MLLLLVCVCDQSRVPLHQCHQSEVRKRAESGIGLSFARKSPSRSVTLRVPILWQLSPRGDDALFVYTFLLVSGCGDDDLFILFHSLPAG